jgi:DNA-binding response OmpR family regulator
MSSKSDDRPTIFLVEEDDDTRPLIRQNLTRLGYRVLIAIDVEDAMERVSGGHVDADLILVNLVGRTIDEALELGQRICKHANFDGATPLVIMAEKYGSDVEGTDVNVGGNDWISYLEDPDQLPNLLARLLPRETS